tara:strand:+ start:103 stop:234 length:132 start_codon:yes stop_codon:yes gene_type:complete
MDNNSENALRDVNDREGGGVNYFVFVRGGGGRKEGGNATSQYL